MVSLQSNISRTRSSCQRLNRGTSSRRSTATATSNDSTAAAAAAAAFVAPTCDRPPLVLLERQGRRRERRCTPLFVAFLTTVAAVALTTWRIGTTPSDGTYSRWDDSDSAAVAASSRGLQHKVDVEEVFSRSTRETAVPGSVAGTVSSSSLPPPTPPPTVEPTMQPFTALTTTTTTTHPMSLVVGAASTVSETVAPTTTSPTRSPTFPTSDWIETKLDQADDYPRYITLSDMLQGPALSLPSVSNTQGFNGTTKCLREAICQFRVVKYGKHFPHVMQQLYRCVSWWLAHRDVPAIFVTGPNTNWAQTTPFIQGFIQVLRLGLNLTVVPEYHSDTSHYIESRLDDSTHMPRNVSVMWSVESKDTGKWEGDTSLTDFALLDPHRTLLDYANQYLRHQKRWDQPNSTTDTVTCRQEEVNDATASTSNQEPRQRPMAPRIAILNRASHRRSLSNAIELQTLLQDTLHQTVPVVSFDSRTNFPTQLSFFLQNDIVITPHGAQLTGMGFLPRCASVLEVFPFRYLVPDYFGSLAAALEIQHGYVYMGNPNEVIPHGERYHYIRRFSQKEDHVSPDLDRVQKAVRDMVEHWKACVCNLASTSGPIMAQE